MSGLPAWSPDGTRLALTLTRDGNTDIYVISADGAHHRRLTTSPAQDDSGLSPTLEIWSVPATGGTPVRLTHNDVPDQAPTYSPDGTQIAFFEPGGIAVGGIAVMGADGSNVRPVKGAQAGWSPRWSPDGTHIAFLDFQGERGDVPQPLIGTGTYSLPLGTVMIVDVATGQVTDTGIKVATTHNAVSWTPSGEALLVNQFQEG